MCIYIYMYNIIYIVIIYIYISIHCYIYIHTYIHITMYIYIYRTLCLRWPVPAAWGWTRKSLVPCWGSQLGLGKAIPKWPNWPLLIGGFKPFFFHNIWPLTFIFRGVETTNQIIYSVCSDWYMWHGCIHNFDFNRLTCMYWWC